MTILPTDFRQVLPHAGDRSQSAWLKSRGQLKLATRRSRHLAAAGLIAAAAIVSGSGIGEPAVACAAPQEWDIGEYDSCVAKTLANYQNGVITFQQYNEIVKDCCLLSGGILSDLQGCVAPAANVPRTLPSGVPTHTLQPAPPPVLRPGSVNPTVTIAPAE
ncbi:MAG: hypothetical protein WBB00_00500 [Mycobacterium sp.]